MSNHKVPNQPFISFDKKYGFYVNFGISYKLLLGVAFAAYLAWEIYWAYKVGYKAIKWHTHLALYIYLCFFLSLLLTFGRRVVNPANYQKYHLVLASVFGTFFLTEATLYALGIGATYTEQLKYGYTSPYSTEYETWYRTRTPNDSFYFIRPEFTHLRKTNSLGFADVEWSVRKRVGQKRILCLGDSFTEGIGAEQDSTYVSQLAYLLAERDTNYLVMNAGTASNDPFVNFLNYRDNLLAYQPDVIIQTLSTNDILTDIALRGGMERFLPNGRIKYNKAPWWEPVYALSNISRLVFTALGYNELLLREADIDKAKMNQLVVQLFKNYAATAQKNNCILLLVLQPLSADVNKGVYEYDFSVITQQLKSIPNVHIYNLLPYYLNYIGKSGIPVSACYWKMDGHHNQLGYKMMAQGMEAGLDSFDIIN